MSFSFNFEDPNLSQEDSYGRGQESDSSLLDAGSKEKVKIKPAMEVSDFYKDEVIEKFEVTSMVFDDCMLRIIDTSCLEQTVLNDELLHKLFSSSNILEAVGSHSDLVSGTYEGGLKIWECAIDLTEFLTSKLDNFDIALKNKSVLEVGCGAGLPGLLCLKKGAKYVHFQDFNEEVLKLLTRTNVKLCSDSSSELTTCRYFSGDWTSFSDLACKENLKYDIILTAETIYNEENYSKLHSLFTDLLTEHGCVLLAAKSYYFGVGGSVEGFLEYVSTQKIFHSEKVYTVSKGVTRYILLLVKIKD